MMDNMVIMGKLRTKMRIEVIMMTAMAMMILLRILMKTNYNILMNCF